MGLVIGIIIFLLLSAFFSGSEIAFVSANKLEVAMQKEEGSQKSRIIHGFFKEPKKFLSTMLIGNNIALVALTFCFTSLVEMGIPSLTQYPLLFLLLTTLILTIIVLIFGEYIPKTFFSLYANQALEVLAYPLYFFKIVLNLPTLFMTGLSNSILKALNLPITKLDYRLSKIDLEDYLDENIGDADDEIDKEILNNVMHLKNVKVRDCMIPRTEIVFIDKSGSMEELIELFQKTKLSRIILIDKDIEEIIGYIHHQQLLTNPKAFQKIAMDIPFVPETLNLNDLLHNFIKQRTSIAAVVDEFGSTAGIITLEDILEEIFGEIEDEHDEEDHINEQLGPNLYRMSGRLEISNLNEQYPELNLPEGEYQTLSGFLVNLLGSIPAEGDQIVHLQNTFTIEQVSDTKIEIVQILVDLNMVNPEVS